MRDMGMCLLQAHQMGHQGPRMRGRLLMGRARLLRRREGRATPGEKGGKYMDASMVDGASGDGLAQVHGRRDGGGEEEGAFLNDNPRAPAPMQENEVARINEKRRKRGASGGLKGWRLRRKGGKEEGVVR